MKKSARGAYDSLYKYFGLRARDGYLEKTTGSKTEEPKATDDSIMGDVYHFLYGDENQNPDIAEICKKIEEMPGGIEKSKDILCVTPFSTDGLGVTDIKKIPLNSKEITGLSDQGLTYKSGQRKPCKDDPKLYTIKELDQEKFDDNDNRIDVIQVFPCRGVSELADTDILTLYLSTIDSVNMSRAVPYVDVTVSVQGEEGSSIATAPFSFGNFLRNSGDVLENDLSSLANFKDQSISGAGTTTIKSADGKEIKRKVQTVASMEIFTSPQTLVNATPERIKYDENTNAGRHVDIFRPFMSIESLSLSVTPSGAGLIAFKNGNMKLKLFDRGNLSKIAPLIAPSRFGLVKFDIEYGWAHPAGDLTSRPSDAQDDRIGQLIDSMRVKESYQVINSNFTFEADGSVSIDLKLSMLGGNTLSTSSVNFSGTDSDAEEIEYLLNEVQKLLSNAPKNINVPAFISGGADTFINMKSEDRKKLRSFANALSKGKSANGLTKSIAQNITALIGNKDKSDSVNKRFQDNRKQQVSKFIEKLRSSDDPFLRTEGLCGYGITKQELTGESNTNYASLGNILVHAIGPSLQKAGDVVFIFSCFNKNAGAVYDHNIAQFPIKLVGKNDKQVVLKTVLEKAMKKTSRITPEAFLQLLVTNFILRESSEAYGLSELYKDQPTFDKDDQIKEEYQKGVKKDSENPESQLQFEDKKIRNLKNIYGSGRNHPTFTTPRIAMKIDSKPSQNGENILRVLVFDQAATNIGDMQEIFNDVTSNGFFEKEDFTKPATGVRSSRHGEIAEKVFEKLESNKLIVQYTAASGEPATLLEKLESIAGNVKFEPVNSTARTELIDKMKRVFFLKDFEAADVQLRNIFYKFFPTLIYGSMGSGIISAQLSSNQNDALNTIALQKEPNETEIPVGLPMVIHPTQLSLDVFGTPLFKYSQKFFVDFGTGTSADNFYVVGGVDMNFGPGDFKCSLKMIQLDVFGRFMRTRDTIYKTLINSYRKEAAKPAKTTNV